MNRTLLRSAAAAAALVLAATSLAQTGSGIAAPKTDHQAPGASGAGPGGNTLTPPRPSELKPVSPLGSYAVLVVLGGAILGLSIMPSKRGHQD